MIKKFSADGKILLLVIAILIFVLMLWMIAEAIGASRVLERKAGVEPFPTFPTTRTKKPAKRKRARARRR